MTHADLSSGAARVVKISHFISFYLIDLRVYVSFLFLFYVICVELFVDFSVFNILVR